MDINKKMNLRIATALRVITTILGILAICRFVSFYVMGLFFGFSQFFDGLNQISMAKEIDLNEISKKDKFEGLFSIIFGIVIIIIVIIKITSICF